MKRPVSNRELQIAELIHWGATEKEISYHLGISVDTVKSHKKNIFNKTGCRNIADVTRWYTQFISGIKISPSKSVKKFLVSFMLFILVAVEIADSEFLRPRAKRVKSIKGKELNFKIRPRARRVKENYLMTA